MPAIEPDRKSCKHPAQKFFLATRPAFLLATLVPVLLGLAYTHWKGFELNGWNAFLTIIAALSLHAGVNVLNDYYDSLNGTDDNNQERIFPFTGGSRFIQNGVISQSQTLRFGIYLIMLVVLIGVYLISQTGLSLFLLGIFGIFIGWAYSAPPLQLNSRGLGEITVLTGFTLLPLGSWLVQTHQLSTELILIALPSGLLTLNLLYINQFPDRKADIKAGKLHWVARLDPLIARWGYTIIATLAYLVIVALVFTKTLPAESLISIIPAFLSLFAARVLLRSAEQPERLEPAIKMTISAMLLQDVLLILSLLFIVS